MAEAAKRKDIDSLFALKAICAFCVVIIHTHIAGFEYVLPLMGLAVPTFFAISGFFLYSGDASAEIGRALRWVKKSLVLTMVLTPLYAVYLTATQGYINASPATCLKIVTGHYCAGHLWYLYALWQALLVFAAMRKFCPWALGLFFLFFAWDASLFLFGGLNPAVKYPDEYFLTVFSRALPMLMVGYTAAKYRHFWEKGLVWDILMVVVLIVLFGVQECTFHTSSGKLFDFILSAGEACMLLMLCVRHQGWSLPCLSWIGKHHSADIYYLHALVAPLCIRGGGYFIGPIIIPLWALVTFVATLCLSVVWQVVWKRICACRKMRVASN